MRATAAIATALSVVGCGGDLTPSHGYATLQDQTGRARLCENTT